MDALAYGRRTSRDAPTVHGIATVNSLARCDPMQPVLELTPPAEQSQRSRKAIMSRGKGIGSVRSIPEQNDLGGGENEH